MRGGRGGRGGRDAEGGGAASLETTPGQVNTGSKSIISQIKCQLVLKICFCSLNKLPAPLLISQPQSVVSDERDDL